MNEIMMINTAVVALNTLLLSTLVVLYGRMLAEVRTRLTWGLLIFAGLLLLQNVVQVYFFFTMQDYYSPGLDRYVLVQNGLATAATLFLVAVTVSPIGRPSRMAEPDA